ncbi:MAG: glycosyltransferase family 4 protein [Candidatus Shapirobacteria bacterium]|jgi:glycosyltransferase involved in cell wall biosynthesis
MSLRAAIYDPYLDTLGGGERYCLTVGEILLKNNYHVDLFWSGNQDIIAKAETRFNLSLRGIKCLPDIFGLASQKIELIDEDNINLIHSQNLPHQNFHQKINRFIQKYQTLSKYDLVFYLSDGSVPFLFSKKNFLHVQVPFVNRESVKEKIVDTFKNRFVHQVICNSHFTAKFLTRFPENKVKVLYPPIDVEKFSVSEKKENIILSVGRFDNILNAKKQDTLIEAFRKIFQQQPNLNWKLILMGGSREEPKNNHYLIHLQHLAQGLPIEFIINPNFDKLKETYSIAKIYWHAAGYGVDEYLHPEETEHFGMSVVEAMASGAVPMVVTKGGLTEIVTDAKNGYTWQTLDELVAKTQLLLVTPKDIQKLSLEAQNSSKLFSKEKFASQLLDLIK